MSQQRVLLVATSNDRLGDNAVELTGAWASEIALPFYAFRAKGYDVTLSSIRGGTIPFDPASMDPANADYKIVQRFFDDEEVVTDIHNTASIAYQLATDYDVLYIVGGHGILWDGYRNEDLERLVRDFFAADKTVATCSHGAVALLGVQVPIDRSLPDGPTKKLLKGQRVTAPSREEEEATGLVDWLPFLLEDRLKMEGAKFEVAQQLSLRDGYVIPNATKTAGHLITGQNHASARVVTDMVIEDTSFGVRLTP